MSERNSDDASQPIPPHIARLRGRVWNPPPDQLISPSEAGRRIAEALLKAKFARQSKKPSAVRQRVYRAMKSGSRDKLDLLDQLDQLDKLDIAQGCMPAPRGSNKLSVEAAIVARKFAQDLRTERHRQAAQSGKS